MAPDGGVQGGRFARGSGGALLPVEQLQEPILPPQGGSSSRSSSRPERVPGPPGSPHMGVVCGRHQPRATLAQLRHGLRLKLRPPPSLGFPTVLVPFLPACSVSLEPAEERRAWLRGWGLVLSHGHGLPLGSGRPGL